jgi:hypothetical protein
VSDASDLRQPKPPKTKARFEQLITQWQKDSGQPVARLNLRRGVIDDLPTRPHVKKTRVQVSFAGRSLTAL